MFKKTITSDFFTTISLRQAFLSVYLMSVGSYKLRYGKDRELFEKQLGEYLGKEDKKIVSFYNGRNALFHCLKLIGVEKNDEVVVNSYTCSVVVNAVIQTGAKIVYLDIESETYSFDYEALEKNIGSHTKVLVLQHTFGKQARDYKKIIELAREKNIIVIEDCALSLGNKKEILGDFAIFSTGRDKTISSVTGGFLLVNSEKYEQSEYIKTLGSELKMPSRKLVFQNLMYNLVGMAAYKFYDFFKLGRVVMFASRKLNLIPDILCAKEKNFEFHDFELAYPNSLAYLARKELAKLDEYLRIRKENAQYLEKNINNKAIFLPFSKGVLSEEGREGGIIESDFNYFRIPILLESQEQAEKLYNYMRKNNVLLGKAWTGTQIVPVGTNLEKAQYTQGSCPVAEDISKRILFLPNHVGVNTKDLKRVVELINNYK